ncbi:MAG: putative sulfate exporter family transporter, partial [Deltaproteobacteria bacterium]|nr:putative sulfate exporter family transporter [Deltaproteobacteria bacterium]
MTEENLDIDHDEQFVVDRATSSWSDLWKKEDYWSIWLGFLLLIFGLVVFFNNPPEGMNDKIKQANAVLTTESNRAPFKTVSWYQALDAKSKLKATNSSIGKTIKKITSKPHGWKTNPNKAFWMDDETAEAKRKNAIAKYEKAKGEESVALAAASVAEAAAAAKRFNSDTLNSKAGNAIDKWRAAHSKVSSMKKKVSAAKPYNQIFYLLGIMIFMAFFFGTGMAVMGKSMPRFMLGFSFVFLIALLSYAASSQTTMKHYGIGYAAWAILFGLIISNTVGTPKWVMAAVQTEYYIKTGLVLLGAEILFGKILSIGIPGIFVA